MPAQSPSDCTHGKWTVVFGNVTYIPVDTLQHAFQNSNDMGGYTGQYNYLGNLGSPASHASFLTVGTPANTFSPTHTIFCVQRPEDVIFTNTLSPFTNLTYYKGGGSRDGEERFKSYFAINANKRLGFGFYIDYLYGRGFIKISPQPSSTVACSPATGEINMTCISYSTTIT